MRDAFAAAHSDPVQNQIELSSSIESALAEAASVGACANQIADIGEMLKSFSPTARSANRGNDSVSGLLPLYGVRPFYWTVFG